MLHHLERPQNRGQPGPHSHPMLLSRENEECFKKTPLPETVALVEDIVVEYITDMVHKAQVVASKRGKLLTEDFLFLIRKDTPKLHRCTELLSMNEELKQARKAFEVDEEKLATID
ncbi:transcription initiation factor TFIID subunit 13 isoform X2 [Nymphaea colorata]|uniref:transcription initiation factor TFIID subunit 13 isoform X2 n=1 Tax=Nymphaea colorata TaxID=210225 RepID=UPI00129D78F3|nr:transcription initiation factor TFIID subunit 13 isoform X2 [Nymphaea colorata]